MVDPYGFIYVIENLINGKVYIGQTTNPDKRWSKHCSEKSHCYAIYNAIQKHGKENFDFVILESCVSAEELNSREKFWIDYSNCISPSGYNLKTGGGSSGKCSEETKRRISASKKGSKWSIEQRKKHKLSNPYSKRVSCPRGHLYDSENTYIRPNGHRMCRACHRQREKARQHRIRELVWCEGG